MRINVLVVEDDAQIAELFEQLITIEGHSVTLAGDADKAIRQLETNENEFDLVITDHEMPRYGKMRQAEGFRVIEFAKQMPIRPFIVWMSGRASGEPGLIGDALDQGADRAVCKPFQVRELHDIIQLVSAQKQLQMTAA